METSTRRPCFDIDGSVSIVEMQSPPGHSGAGNYYSHPHAFLSKWHGSIRNLASCSSPRLGRLYDSRFEEVNNHPVPPHFLEACFLCKKPLGINRDIFMYRGDTPFCSEECRQEQIDEDESNERKQNLKTIKTKKKDPSSVRIIDYAFQTGGTVAASAS